MPTNLVLRSAARMALYRPATASSSGSRRLLYPRPAASHALLSMIAPAAMASVHMGRKQSIRCIHGPMSASTGVVLSGCRGSRPHDDGAASSLRIGRRLLSSSANTSLLGVWKISTSIRDSDASSASEVVIPRRIRFVESSMVGDSSVASDTRASILESGNVLIPYADHCHGTWEVATVKPVEPSSAVDEHGDDELARAAKDADGSHGTALAARFVIRGLSRDGGDASRLLFDGLYDGERIAGTVWRDDSHDQACGGAQVADFLCTRLFTFWGTPKPAAARRSGSDAT